MDLPGSMPIVSRELNVPARVGRLRWPRVGFAGTMVSMIVGSFVAAWYSRIGEFGPRSIRNALQNAFWQMAGLHVISCFAVIGLAAASIAREKERRTLDFLLTTCLSNAEIILGKLISCVLLWLTTIASGLPIMLMMVLYGGIDPGLVLLMYGAILSLAFFLASIGLMASTEARNTRGAINAASRYLGLWFFLPLFLAWLLPRFGLRLPPGLKEINAWVLASSPLSLIIKRPAGLSIPILADIVFEWFYSQFLMGIAFLAIAILRLRTAYRVHTGDAPRTIFRWFGGPARGRRKRPDVGDDPIFWRERYTNRYQGAIKYINFLVHYGLALAILSGALYFGRPALVEVWKNGYNSGPTTTDRPDMNLFVKVFVPPAPGALIEADEARISFNIYLRVLVLIVATTGIAMASFASESIIVERAKETWLSLISSPLSGREILISKRKTALWRVRPAFLGLACLWTFGMIAGALHPVGVMVAALQLAAMTWMSLNCGMLAAVRARRLEPGNRPLEGLVSSLTFTGALPFVMPSGFKSVFWGVVSLPFNVWIALVSYRDVRAALRFPGYPPLRWLGLDSGEGFLSVAVCASLAIIVPAIVGTMVWRHLVTHFDRYVGRPWNDSANPVR